MSDTLTLSCPRGKKNGGRGHYTTLTVQTPLQGLELPGLEPPFYTKSLSSSSAFPVAPKSTTSTSVHKELISLNPLVSGDVGLDLPNHICFPEGRKATLKQYQNKHKAV